MLACLLTATILLEYRDARGRQAAMGASLAGLASEPTRVPVPKAPAPATTVSAAALDGWSRTILERPLFSPSRRPGRAAVASTVVPRLAGIIIGPTGAKAIFASADGSRAIVAGAGAHVGPYVVRIVSMTGVFVIGPNGPELLHPVYDHNAARGTAVTPAGATPSILDLLRGRIHGDDAMRSPLLPPPTLQTPPRARR